MSLSRVARSFVASLFALFLALTPAIAAACNCRNQQTGCAISANMKLGVLLLLLPSILAMTIFLVVRRASAIREGAQDDTTQP